MVEAIKRGVKKSWSTYLSLMKIIIPVYILVTFLKYTGVIGYFDQLFSPMMKLVGLPGEAALALLTGYLMNIYGALGVIAGLDLGAREITILGTMLGLAHSLIIEGAIIKRIRVRLFPLISLRIILSLVSGIILNILL
ncbi:nucleoside recognition protein [Orenia metallireducens]|uniref:Nucleoside recognition n=1 Tax=Orenia metallireducens TaxID=1413210 RepID=A0A285HI90_9FIRM|nr:nucleoside recognition domain-containing protein [Orenia metallireducens]PRX27211.1 nucleoside recognition protein [Orenia metallireducens]SNY35387.1 Nucleoside recognition [Orenia metallireducens]